MAGKGWFTYAKPDAAHKVALELCVSGAYSVRSFVLLAHRLSRRCLTQPMYTDVNKPLLLANSAFIPCMCAAATNLTSWQPAIALALARSRAAHTAADSRRWHALPSNDKCGRAAPRPPTMIHN